MAIGFDNALYLEKQAENILQRIEKFNNKLYRVCKCVGNIEKLGMLVDYVFK